jgi:hypothetical protein
MPMALGFWAIRPRIYPTPGEFAFHSQVRKRLASDERIAYII